MYCVKCGVELADSERRCPLCHTPVYMPGIDDKPELSYPVYVEEREKVSLKAINFILSFFFLIAGTITAVCDYNINGALGWSGYVIGGLILLYVIFVLPGWFRRYRPAIFIPVDFAVAALFLAFINYATSGEWFLTFALPVCGGIALIISALVILVYYLHRGRLYIFGGAFIALGAMSLMIEWLMNVTFRIRDFLLWSSYPAIALTLFGIMLIVIAIVKPFKEALMRIFSL